ncbi:MAG: hypothetical protein FWE95_09610 [Planctomycetaceae bacterium]|nr:hypothetical protein [Planctomycetaceae bacterium]
MPILENLKNLVEVTKNTITAKNNMSIVFGKYAPHQHDYHATVYQITLTNPETAAAFAEVMTKNRSEAEQITSDESPNTEPE